MGLKARTSTATARSSEPKTQATGRSPAAFIASLDDPQRRAECETVLAMMKDTTGEPPVMWGKSIVGFGTYHYRYASGREGDWPRIGFSPRKQSLTVYCMPGFNGLRDLLARLGPHRTSVSCLYIRRLDAVDTEVLRAIMERSWKTMARRYPA